MVRFLSKLFQQTIVVLIAIAFSLFCSASAFSSQSSTNITPENVALIINDADQSSINVSQYYQEVRNIPEGNMIHVNLPNAGPRLNVAQFDLLKAEINAQLQPKHLVVLFVWTAPYAVECYAITAAYTLGYSDELCSNSCGPSKPNPYYNKASKNPLNDHDMRLSMLLPSEVFEDALKVIDNGMLSTQGAFKATAYFLKTTDAARSSRAVNFPRDGISFKGSGLSVVNKQANTLMNVHDIMIYHTGLVSVPHLETLNFLPGALADHLTSYGGDLFNHGQMTVLSWLHAGATASYGTVSEPCSHWQKFPNSSVLLKWYALGATAVEAYWKSVAWPSQGLFVGDPLAAPYAY